MNSSNNTTDSFRPSDYASSAGTDSVFEKVETPMSVRTPAAVEERSLAVIDLDLVDTSLNLIENPSTLSSDWFHVDSLPRNDTKTPDAQFSAESCSKTKSRNKLPASSFASPPFPATIAASTPVESKDMFSKADRGGAGDGIEMEALCDREKDIDSNVGGSDLKSTTYAKAVEFESEKVDFKTPCNTTYILKGPAIANEELGELMQEKFQETTSVSTRSSSFEDTSVTSSKSGSKKETKKAERKPLSSLNKAPVTTQTHKRTNTNPVPRMNAAALSRIKAKFPKKQVLQPQDQNTAYVAPSSGAVSVKGKPPVSKHTQAAKKPPFSRPHTSNTMKPPLQKKKNEILNKASRSSKVDVTARPSSTTSLSLRNSANATPRLGNSTAARSAAGNLRRPQVSSSIPHPRAAPVPSSSETSSRSSVRKSVAPGKTTSTALRNRRTLQSKDYKTSQCVVALATLLDHVVNRLDGLSAPKLTAEKDQLERLVSEQRSSNNKLSSRNDDLEESLRESRATHERDEAEMTRLKYLLEATKRNFRQELEDISNQLSKQNADHQLAMESMKEESQNALEDLSSKHEEELAQLRQEWSDEREEMELETQELRSSIDARVEAKVEELIQPYINSYEENKSLRSVLELKNEEQHKLTSEIERQKEQLKEVPTLRDHVTRLRQRNEDLQTQVEEKNIEQRELRNELADRSRELIEQQRINNSQLQKLDELTYRLDTSTPSPASPFNPIFTASPSVSQEGFPNASSSEPRTPTRMKHRHRGFRDFTSGETPQENGAT